MTYFCAKCQKRHPVQAISADMWGILRRETADHPQGQLKDAIDVNLQQLINAYDGSEKEKLGDLKNDLMGFVGSSSPEIHAEGGSGPDRLINAFFELSYRNYKQVMDIKSTDRNVVGTYRVFLGSLLDLYVRWEKAKVKDADSVVPAFWKSMIISEVDLKLFFSEKNVLYKVTGLDNTSFSDIDNVRHGFTHICPFCGRQLSGAAGAAEEIVVGLIGAPRAGKTACMVAMVNSLIERKCPGIHATPMPYDKKWEQLSEEIDRYKKSKKVTKTPEDDKEVPAHSILIEINNDEAKTERVLTFVDIAGEKWTDDGLTDQLYKEYAGTYENVDCIWFLLSKATVRLSTAADVPEDVENDVYKKADESMEIIRKSSPAYWSRNLSVLKRHLQKSLPPVAVIVSKPDLPISAIDDAAVARHCLIPNDPQEIAIQNSEDLASVLEVNDRGLRGMRQDAMYIHASSVREYIREVCPAFQDAIEDNCVDRFYMAVSPYGHEAIKPEEPGDKPPNPYHECYPLIWSLAINGGLKIYQNCRWIRKNFLNMIVEEQTTMERVKFRHQYRNADLPRGKEREKIQNRNRMYNAFGNNLLMNGPRFIQEVVLQHQRQ